MKYAKNPELLAPAGSWKALCAAVQSGADAVYLGGTAFSARAGAGNFDNEQIIEAIRYCHIRGVKVYAALNTLLKQTELKEAFDFACFLRREAGADALIVQDLGLVKILRESLLDMPLHASTQMTVHSIAGAQKLYELGFKRVVLARELSFEQIKAIKNAVDIELEIFVHGAICQCYSGQCLMSSFLGGRSGNRGRCAQPCRLPYELLDSSGKRMKKGYLLSPKDMCLIEHLQEIESTGINSLKIEGRLKRPEYVASVVGIYRKYINSGEKVSQRDMQALLDAFNRSGFTDGYFTGKTGASMMSYDLPSNISAEKFDAEVKKRCLPNANYRLIDVWAESKILHGSEMEFALTDIDGNTAAVCGSIPQEAETAPLSRERAEAQLSKFGSVPFRLINLKLDLDEGISVAVKEINELRRKACDKLAKKRAEVKECKAAGILSAKTEAVLKKDEPEELCASVRTAEQARAVLKLEPDKLYVPAHLADKLDGFTGKTEIISLLPVIVDNKNEDIYDKILTRGVMCSSVGAANKLKDSRIVYGDWRLNVYNSAAIRFCEEAGIKRVTLSPELNLREITALGDCAGAYEVLVYGYLPVMIMKNCIIKACSSMCHKEKGLFFLEDRKKQKFPVLCEPETCTNLLLNSKPLYMADKLSDLKRCGVKKYRLFFTIENPRDCARITEEYQRAIRGQSIKNPFGENAFTRGHFYRGVL